MPSLRRERLDRRAPTAGNFSNGRPCIVLIRRMRSFCTPALFHAQPELRGRPYRERHFQLLVVSWFDSLAFTTHYGWLLLAKLSVFGGLVGLGAWNRFVIKTKLSRVPTDSDLLAQLRRNVICEACLGLAVVAIVACLGVTPPARGS